MKIYTRRGDAGDTGLLGGGRVPKHHPRVEAFGAVDELNAVLGQVVALVEDSGIRGQLTELQNDLFAIGAFLAVPPASAGRPRPETPRLPVGRVEQMESWIDEADEQLSPLRNFILPGGTAGAASLHLARTVCRRAEREASRLAEADDVDPYILRYLNRLSDLLFTWARLENARAGVDDVPWSGSGADGGT